MSLWVAGSRACQVCGATVVDTHRLTHEAFHERVDPVVVVVVVPDDSIDSVVEPEIDLEVDPADVDAEPKKPKKDK